MATRFYLPASGTAPATPAADANWERQFTGWTRRPLVRSKSNTALATLSEAFGDTATQQKLYAQWVSEQLDVDQTIAGTISMVVGKCAETSASGDAHLAFSLRVLKPDGTFRGTLLLYHATSTEFATSIGTASTRIHSARALTSTACLAGDRLVLEIGIHAVTPANEVMQMRFGDPSATGDFALTASLTTDLDPWMELSQNVTFGTPTTHQSVAGAFDFSGGAVKKTSLSARTGPLGFTGALARKTLTKKTGALSFAGTLAGAKKVLKTITGALGFAGAVGRATTYSKLVAGILSATGAVGKWSKVARAGALSFVGAIAHACHRMVLTGGTLDLTGSLRRSTSRALAGVLAFSGVLARKASRLLSGALSFVGDLAALIPSGELFHQAVDGAVSFAGAVSRVPGKVLDGVLDLAGVVGKTTSRLLSGALSFSANIAGVLKDAAEQAVAGVLSFLGSLFTVKTDFRLCPQLYPWRPSRPAIAVGLPVPSPTDISVRFYSRAEVELLASPTALRLRFCSARDITLPGGTP